MLEPHERKAAALMQQLNAIRNEKAKKRREQQERHRASVAKAAEVEAKWRGDLAKGERKKRYREAGMAAKAAAARSGGGKRRKTGKGGGSRAGDD